MGHHSGLNNFKVIISLLYFIAIPAYGQNAQQEMEDIDFYSLEDLLNVEIEVASLFLEDDLMVGSTVSSITPQKWKELGAKKMQDALNNETSLMMYPAAPASYVISIRGYGSIQTMAGVAHLIDGFPVNALFHGTSFYSIPDWNLGTLDKIELIKGPGSAIYGSDAFHGVVSFKTFESDSDLCYIGIAGAYPLYGDAVLNLSQGFLDNAVRIDAAAGTSYQGDQHLEYRTDTNETGERKIEYHSTTGLFKIRIKPADRLELKTGAYVYAFDGTDFPGAGENSSVPLLGKNDFNDSKSYLFMGTASIEYKFINDISVKASGFYWIGKIGTVVGAPAGMYAENHTENDRAGGDFLIKQADNPFNLQWLAAYSFNRLKINNAEMIIKYEDGSTVLDLGELPLMGKSREINSVFGQIKWGAVKERLFLLCGARYDDYSDLGGQFTPRGGIIFLPTKNSSAKALYGRAFRAPAAMEKYGIGDLIYGDPDMKPETIDIYELIYIYKEKKCKLNVNIYYSYWKNAIIGRNSPGRFSNEGESMAYGGEMKLFYSFNIFTVDLGFSYVESYALDAESATDPGITEDQEYSAFPKYSVIAGIYYTLKPWDITFYLNNRIYFGMKETPESTPPEGKSKPDDLPEYYRTDLNISKKIADRLELYLDIRNIFNRENHIPSLFGNREGYVEPGIGVMLRVGYKM